MHRSMSANAVKPLKEAAAVRGCRDKELVFKAPCPVAEQQRSEAPVWSMRSTQVPNMKGLSKGKGRR